MARERLWHTRNHRRVVSSSPLKALLVKRGGVTIVAFMAIGQRIVNAQRSKKRKKRRRRKILQRLMLMWAHCSWQ
jgi:hypothetical protein